MGFIVRRWRWLFLVLAVLILAIPEESMEWIPVSRSGMFIIVVVALVLVGFAQALSDRRRATALQLLAAHNDLEYDREIRQFKDEWLRSLAMFGADRHDGYRIENVLTGPDMVVFDYVLITGVKDEEYKRAYTAVALRDEARHLPFFEVRPRSGGIQHPFGSVDSVFRPEEDPLFSRVYAVEGIPDEEVRRYFTAKLRRGLEALPGWRIEGHVGWVAVYREDETRDANGIPELIEQAQRISQLFTAADRSVRGNAGQG